MTYITGGGTPDGNDITRIQNGIFISTGGTENAPTINLAQNISGATVSAGTIYSGSTNIYNLFDHKVRRNAGINVFNINAGVRFPLTGASITFNAGELQVGTTWEVFINISKTNAGTASNTWSMHLGTLGTSADTLVSAFSGVTQTAIADNGVIRGTFTVLTGGTTGYIQSSWELNHRANTGFANANGAIISGMTSASINLTTPTRFTIHFSGGSSSVVTINQVTSKMYRI